MRTVDITKILSRFISINPRNIIMATLVQVDIGIAMAKIMIPFLHRIRLRAISVWRSLLYQAQKQKITSKHGFV